MNVRPRLKHGHPRQHVHHPLLLQLDVRVVHGLDVREGQTEQLRAEDRPPLRPRVQRATHVVGICPEGNTAWCGRVQSKLTLSRRTRGEHSLATGNGRYGGSGRIDTSHVLDKRRCVFGVVPAILSARSCTIAPTLESYACLIASEVIDDDAAVAWANRTGLPDPATAKASSDISTGATVGAAHKDITTKRQLSNPRKADCGSTPATSCTTTAGKRGSVHTQQPRTHTLATEVPAVPVTPSTSGFSVPLNRSKTAGSASPST